MIQYKNPYDKEHWSKVHPNLITLRDYFEAYCDKWKFTFVVTSIIRPKIDGISTSTTHEEGRAYDASVFGWDIDSINDLVIDCNKQFAKSIGAISAKDGIARAVIYHFGTGPHFHFQVRKV